MVRENKHSRAILGQVYEELTYRKTERAKALLRDVLALLEGHVRMPQPPPVPDSPESQLGLLDPES